MKKICSLASNTYHAVFTFTDLNVQMVTHMFIGPVVLIYLVKKTAICSNILKTYDKKRAANFLPALTDW